MSKQRDLRSFFDKSFNKKNVHTQEQATSAESYSDKEISVQKKGRRFLNEWLSKYKWLRYENDMMYCDVCISAKDSILFIEYNSKQYCGLVLLFKFVQPRDSQF